LTNVSTTTNIDGALVWDPALFTLQPNKLYTLTVAVGSALTATIMDGQ
jgi:ABC-type taurine transport system substrate-binding protein